MKKERADSILTRVIIPYLSSNRIAIGCRSLLAGVAPFVQTCDRHRGPAALPFCHCASRPSRVLRARARACVRAPVARGSRRRTCWLAWQDGLRIHIHPPLPLSAAWLVVHTHNSTSVIAAKNWLFLNISHRVGWVWMCVRVYTISRRNRILSGCFSLLSSVMLMLRQMTACFNFQNCSYTPPRTRDLLQTGMWYSMYVIRPLTYFSFFFWS